jgi:hypothetical protein
MAGQRNSGRLMAADGLNSQRRMDGQRRAPVGDAGGKVTASNAPRPRADRSGVQDRRLFRGAGAPFGQSR